MSIEFKKNLSLNKIFMYKFTLISPTQNTIDNIHNILFLNKELRKFKRINLKSTTVNNNLLRRYPLFLREFKKNLYKFHGTNKILNLNFPRNRFFPNFRTIKGETYTFLSLGMFSKFFLKNKSFFKTKQMYLILASFLRKILLFSSLKFLYLIVTNIPTFLKEIMATINNSVINHYKNPFNESNFINEKSILNPFKFSFFMFINNKPYGKIKNKKKGRLKRKITKRLIQINKVLD